MEESLQDILDKVKKYIIFMKLEYKKTTRKELGRIITVKIIAENFLKIIYKL